jgi:restriction system protein
MNEFPIVESFGKGIFLALKMALPAFLIMGIFLAVKWYLARKEKIELARSGIDQIDKMNGKEFEKYLEVLFEKLGFRVERTRYTGDFGADLVTAKDGVKTVIQAKRHKSKVGVKAIQEAVASKGFYGCTKAIVVTNSYFTTQAKRLAESNDVLLWDRKALAQAMNSMQLAIPPEGIPVMTDGVNIARVITPKVRITDLNTAGMDIPPNPTVKNPTNGAVCTLCGKPVSEKVKDYCLNHQKRFGGKIFCYDHQRQV